MREVTDGAAGAGTAGAGTAGAVAADVVTADVGQDARAPASARRLTREVLTRWRLGALLDDVLVVVSELVTNAVRHGRPPVRLVLRRLPGSLQVAVADADPELPDPARPAAAVASAVAEGGRGLAIVEALADGVGRTPGSGSGKTVVASFRLGCG